MNSMRDLKNPIKIDKKCGDNKYLHRTVEGEIVYKRKEVFQNHVC